MTFIPSASCDSTNSRSNRSINTSRFPGCNVYCRSSMIGQQVCGGCAFRFSTPELCAANETVAIRNFNPRKKLAFGDQASIIAVVAETKCEIRLGDCAEVLSEYPNEFF